jgi:hypothetical protein
MFAPREEPTIWRSVAKCLLTIAALLIVSSAPLREDMSPVAPNVQSYVFAALSLASVIFLHWSLWRFIVPRDVGSNIVSTSFIRSGESGYRRGFYAGSISFGYCMVVLYCSSILGILPPERGEARVGFLALGLLLIGIGTAARLREIFLCLSLATNTEHASSAPLNETVSAATHSPPP